MICPFRVGAEFTYIIIPGKDGEDEYLNKEQKAVYPECYENECPYYNNIFSSCSRIGED